MNSLGLHLTKGNVNVNPVKPQAEENPLNNLASVFAVIDLKPSRLRNVRAVSPTLNFPSQSIFRLYTVLRNNNAEIPSW